MFKETRGMRAEAPSVLDDEALGIVVGGSEVASQRGRSAADDIPDCIIWNIDGADVSGP